MFRKSDKYTYSPVTLIVAKDNGGQLDCIGSVSKTDD